MKKQIFLALITLATIAQPVQAKDFFNRLNDGLIENPYWGIGLGLFTGIALTGIGFHSYYSPIVKRYKAQGDHAYAASRTLENEKNALNDTLAVANATLARYKSEKETLVKQLAETSARYEGENRALERTLAETSARYEGENRALERTLAEKEERLGELDQTIANLNGTITASRDGMNMHKIRGEKAQLERDHEGLKAHHKGLTEENKTLKHELGQSEALSHRYKTALSNTLRCFAGLNPQQRETAENAIGTNDNGLHLATLLIFRNMGLAFYNARNTADLSSDQKFAMAASTCLSDGCLIKDMQVDAKKVQEFYKMALNGGKESSNFAATTIDAIIQQRCGFDMTQTERGS